MRLSWTIIFVFKLVYCLRAGKHYTSRDNRLDIIPRCTNNNLLQLESLKLPRNNEKMAFSNYWKYKLKRFYFRQTLKVHTLLLKYYLRVQKRQFNKLVKRFLGLFKKSKDPTHSPNYPLVGNTWVVEFNNRPNVPNLPDLKEQLEFMDGGKVVTSSGLQGTWWVDFGELMWKLPLDEGKDRYMYFTAQLYMDKSSKKPKMRRGVMFKDRVGSKWLPKNLFRPVVGTFEAYSL